MRVISGKYKGRKIEGYNIIGTRPTMDRVKESMFAMINKHIKEAIALDLFAGTGSLGIEALSNGAKECHFVEKNKEMAKILKSNLEKIDNYYIHKIDFREYLLSTNKKFDLIILDPPYNGTFISESLKLIDEKNLLNEDGIIVCEYESENISHNFEILKEKTYGSKKIMILTRK